MSEIKKTQAEISKEKIEKIYNSQLNKDNIVKISALKTEHETMKKELQSFMQSIIDCKIDDTEIIPNETLTVYIPTKNVAIKFNSNVFDSEAFLYKSCETTTISLTNKCEEKGIRLIHIYSDEWKLKKAIVKSMLGSAVGHYDKKYMARKLTPMKIDHTIGCYFFKKNHIQGNANAKAYYALFDGGTIVQVVSIGISRFKKDKSVIELIRMATRLNSQVLGGFSKLIKYAMQQEKITKIESYVDRRLFNASGYKAAGWILTDSSNPRYFYTNGDTRENRQAYMKQSCLKKWPECPSIMTEHELCLTHYLYRIYDSGTFISQFSLDENSKNKEGTK